MRITTKRGYDFGEMSSAMQKAIRRADTRLAGYWALELWHSGFGNYVWKRLLTVSAEDVWGLITSEIKALHDSYVFVNKTVPAKQPKGRIFISKAVILLCAARKSRHADHLQNFVYDALAGIDADSRVERDRLRGAQPEGPRQRKGIGRPVGGRATRARGVNLAAELLKAGKKKVPDYAFDCQRPPSPPCGLRFAQAISLRSVATR